jgi:phosphate:Na+ symporter
MLVREVSRMDNVVDKLDDAIKLYITPLPRGSLDEHKGRRAMEIIPFSISLEHIGDIIDKNRTDSQADQAQVHLPSLALTGVYHDLWRKTAVGWRFAHLARRG